jgi:hypothetical protein|nr:hypothetical protein [uncultured Mitsuokella sp.]
MREVLSKWQGRKIFRLDYWIVLASGGEQYFGWIILANGRGKYFGFGVPLK